MVGALVAAAALFALRVGKQPLQPYGSNAAEYIEHAVRLEVAAVAQRADSLPALLFAADEAVLTHPPGLHLVTLPAHALLGRSAEAIVWTGFGWHLLLALALGACAFGLTRRRRAVAAALCAGLLFPAGLAAATRYHYDLPMTALIWSAAGLLLLARDRFPLRAGAAAGLLLAAATLVKWTALPLGAIVALAALWPEDRARVSARLRAGSCLSLAWAAPVLAFLHLSLSSFQAGVMAVEGEPAQGDVGPLAVPLAFAGRIVRSLVDADPGSLLWYPAALVVALFSPLLVGVSLPLLRAWWRGGEARALVLIAVLGQCAVLALGLSVLDERFALTAAPALLLAAALGAARLPTGSPWPVLVLAVAALVGAEFHGSTAGPWNRVQRVGMGPVAPALSLRGPWLGDSFEGRGWSSAATTPSSAPEQRAATWAAIRRCGVEQLGYVDGLSDQGDTWWLRYEARLHDVDLLVLSHGSLGPRRFWWPDPDTHASVHEYEQWGFSMDAVGDPGAFGPLNEVELALNLRALGLRIAALEHFQPTVAISRIPVGTDTPIDASWRPLERIDAGDAEPLALHGRGPLPCPGPPFEAPPSGAAAAQRSRLPR